MERKSTDDDNLIRERRHSIIELSQSKDRIDRRHPPVVSHGGVSMRSDGDESQIERLEEENLHWRVRDVNISCIVEGGRQG